MKNAEPYLPIFQSSAGGSQAGAVNLVQCFAALPGELRDGAIVAELGAAEVLGRVRDAPVICENRGQNGSGRAFLTGDTVWRL